MGGGGEDLVGQGGPGTPGRDQQVSHRQVHQVVVDRRPANMEHCVTYKCYAVR